VLEVLKEDINLHQKRIEKYFLVLHMNGTISHSIISIHRARKTLGVLFAGVAILKLTALSYLTGIFYSLMPVSWVGWMSADLLRIGIIAVIAIELLLGLFLWKGWYLPYTLWAALLYLAAMGALNVYQWVMGIGDCGCLGGWIKLPPEITLVKTSLLLGAVIYLKILHRDFGKALSLSLH